MGSPLHRISKSSLDGLAADLESGRLGPSTLGLGVPRVVADGQATAVIQELARLFAAGFTGPQLAETLRLLSAERSRSQLLSDRVELVWSGPESSANQSRQTSVVMNELFQKATDSVLASGYAVYQGRQVFARLAQRMDEDASLRVRLFLNVARPHLSIRSEQEILREFADELRARQWPGRRLPEVFYDPRALEPGSGPKASLHAKCVVVDERYALITSANLTEAAQERNIEAGVLIDDAPLARALSGQFENLVSTFALRRVPGI